MLTEGTKAIVGGRPATVESSHATVDKLFVRVRVDYPDRDTALAAPAGYLAWALLAEGRIVEPLADETTCGAPLGPDDPWTVSCDLVYPATKGTKTLAFRSGDAQRLWRISA